ncbi:MAG: amino acid adenylation domain-containing protein [Verrucomicrobia bacterium]|nr:amino acid adenylation domain-containing protein [Verrucomicrobiota bacterium]
MTRYSNINTVHELFRKRALAWPEAMAVRSASEKISYAELDRRSDWLAAELRKDGAGVDRVIGLVGDRSIDTLVALLGILKADAAYLPLDPRYPRERLGFMIDDSAVGLVLGDGELVETLPLGSARAVRLDRLSWGGESVAGASAADGSSLAYVIYTSGSTGKPKGVAMVHQALVNLIEWQTAASALGVGSRTLQFTSLSFDVSFQEIFATWCSGGTLVLMEEKLRWDASGLWRCLGEAEINRLFLPFVALQQLAEAADESEQLPTSLSEVITAGEQLQVTPKIRRLFQRLPGCRLHNHYGPSETHVVTAYELPSAVDEWPLLPSIGRPIANTSLHLLDEHRKTVAEGATGEIYLGGACLARGYLNRPDLTAERFVPDPSGAHAGGRLYRTGDLARRQPDGNIEFLGRSDYQVKIRGHRVELGEIEAVLAQHPDVRECAVVAHRIGPDIRLVGYVVAQSGRTLDVTRLRDFVGERLTDYMVPSAFVVLERLPLTPNGKVDRRNLPLPAVSRSSTTEFVAPRSRVEQDLAGIWREVLGLEQVGVCDNFFDLGGTSLGITRVHRELGVRLGREVEVTALFQHPTIEALAKYLERDSTFVQDLGAAARARAAKQRVAYARPAALKPEKR